MKSIVIGGAFASALICASTTYAQTTPEAFLDEIVGLYEKQGAKLEIGSQSRDGNTLSARDVSLNMTSQGSVIKMSIEGFDITKIDNPDYDLELSVPETLNVSVDTDVENVEIHYGISVTSSGRYLIGGDKQSRVFSMDYPSVSISVDEFTIEGEELLPVGTTISLFSNNYSGEIIVTDGSHVNYDMHIADAGMLVKFAQGGINIDFSTILTGIELTGDGPVINMTDYEVLLASDIPTTMSLIGESSKTEVIGSGENNFNFTSTGGPSYLKANIGKGMLDYDLGGSNTVISVSADAMPIPPLEIGIASVRSRIAIPMIPNDTAQQAAYLLDLDGVTVSEGVWSLVDPGKAIPRDPMTILLDLTGSVRAIYSLFDNEEVLARMGEVPFEIQDLRVNALKLSAGGAQITGSGEAQFNNDGPIPVPFGAVDFKITGINGLIETLVGAGILPAEQAMPAQMVLGMFAKPGSSPDEFSSRIEMGEDGSITANGIPLQ